MESTQQRSRLGEPTSFVDHVYLGCTQRQCERSKDVVDNYRTMFEFRISRDELKSFHTPRIFVFLHGPTIWKVMQRNVWSDIFELANKTTQQLYKVSTPCIDDHLLKEEEMKSVGELSQVCSHIVLKCLYLARIGRPDILWSVNKLARSITKWTKACDKRLNRLISYIHHICAYKQYCYVVTLQNNAGWDCFKTPILQEILRTQNPLLEEHDAFLEVIHLFQEVGCARNKLPFYTVQQNLKSSLWTLD